MTLKFALLAWPSQLTTMPPRVFPHSPVIVRPRVFRRDPQFVYRIDYLYSHSEWLTSRILGDGHIYGTKLENLTKHRQAKMPYVEEVFTNLDMICIAGLIPQVKYFWDNEYLARHFQLTHIRDFNFIEMDARRLFTGQIRDDELARLPLISRVRRSHLPRGIFIPDLNPHLTPFGQAHVIATVPGEIGRIPSSQIQFWYQDQWVHIRSIDLDMLRKSIDKGALSRIVPQPSSRLMRGG
ncbi:hypothetical protein [Pelagibacterium luteolum]|uniref:Uncharacterized protein n=1 Tax=Pelagibacterium luteolum TaxID=440168 RepID=A0A1G7ZPH9_9HYPH|nr:hypothetical protein [Pelagibacterium luteolum]SDH10535.1 hypothetical protein SAMN04487974_12152 [Pelagibacterium luteolum]